jgi:hypothetical protein
MDNATFQTHSVPMANVKHQLQKIEKEKLLYSMMQMESQTLTE